LLTAPFPGLARTIFGDPERYRSQYFRQFPGAYSTADAAIEDLDGHIWVLGRVDDVINVSGHRLSTMEMESALLEVEGVSEAAVIGVADNIKGMVPVAFVTVNRQSPAMSQDDWQQFLSQSVVDAIGTIARPAQVFRLDAMPKTRSGKIVRRLLKELLQNGQATGDITGLEDPEILPVIMEQIGNQEQ
jgi:acetyl-CoA synthetase